MKIWYGSPRNQDSQNSISEFCPDGKYRATNQTDCDTCGDGEVPVTEKSACAACLAVSCSLLSIIGGIKIEPLNKIVSYQLS